MLCNEAYAVMRYLSVCVCLSVTFVNSVKTNKHRLASNFFSLSGSYTIPVFTARSVCVARTMTWQDVCPSVCLSVCLSHAGIESKRLYMSSKVFSPSGNPTILVFPYQTGCQYSNGDPLTGASNARGYEKNHDFRPISRFI